MQTFVIICATFLNICSCDKYDVPEMIKITYVLLIKLNYQIKLCFINSNCSYNFNFYYFNKLLIEFYRIFIYIYLHLD